MYSTYPLIAKYLDGTAASGLYEAKLGREEFGKEVHVFSAAFREKEIDEILKISDHIVFNSFGQWQKYRKRAVAAGISCGIRINPQFRTQRSDIYDPCADNSRLGVTKANFRPDLLDGIEGLHFHTLCEQNSDALVETLAEVEKKFGEYIYRMKWVNFGGGHHITRSDYDCEKLINCIKTFKEKYGVEVYLEPGEAVALNAGFLVATVLDIVSNGASIAILDASAACHMPDVIEMPYRPPLYNSGAPQEKKYTYLLAGATCLAGDVIGSYSFDGELNVGDKLIFEDMAIYSMVKNNTFNGVPLPDILLRQKDNTIKTIKTFTYPDFKSRL